MIEPKNILFIKLGEKGSFEKECIENKKIIKLGYREIPHELCINEKWNDVDIFIKDKYNTNKGATTSHRNQIKKFYTEPNSTMWITFYSGKLWFCFADPEVFYDAEEKTKYRKTIDGWHSVDSNNNPLFIQALSGKLTKVQGFRGTICDVTEKSYLTNKINNTQNPISQNIENNLSALKLNIEKLIKHLSPQDFEIFVDLIFRNAGWSRVGLLGKTIKTIDIELLAPVTGERAIVQVKSQSDLKLFQEYKDRLNIPEYDRCFFITHSPNQQLQEYIDNNLSSDIQIWNAKKLADLSVNAGLIDWLISTAG
jgi:hypothetical protein